MKAINQLLLSKEQDLKNEKMSLEEKVVKRTKELEEAKASLEVKVEERTRELNDKIQSLEKMNKIMVDRECRMAEMKEEARRLNKKLEQPESHTGDGA